MAANPTTPDQELSGLLARLMADKVETMCQKCRRTIRVPFDLGRLLERRTVKARCTCGHISVWRLTREA